jgi:hypothetical protein
VPISPKLAHQVNNTLQEAMGALDMALVSEEPKVKDSRIRQSKDAMRRVAELVAANTIHSEPQ